MPVKRIRVSVMAAAILGGLLVAACSNDDLLPGVGYRVPGESTSAELLPLTVPPDFGLRPEPVDETAEGFGIVSSQEEEIVVVQNDTITLGEEIILSRSDVESANPDIRRLLDQDNAIFVGNPEFVDALMFGSFPEGGAVTVEEDDEAVQDVVIREGVGDDESDFEFFEDWF